MSVNMNDPGQLNGTTVVGGDGEKLGNVDAVYYDNATDRAEWVAVRSGLFGTRVTLVPLRRADYTGDELRVPFDKVQLRNAPHHDPGNELSSTDEADLYRYYGIDYSDTADGFAGPADHEEPGTRTRRRGRRPPGAHRVRRRRAGHRRARPAGHPQLRRSPATRRRRSEAGPTWCPLVGPASPCSAVYRPRHSR